MESAEYDGCLCGPSTALLSVRGQNAFAHTVAHSPRDHRERLLGQWRNLQLSRSAPRDGQGKIWPFCCASNAPDTLNT
eukprot:scaffold699_cov231-Pinguiococcus_pyrenoidosus.AAC.14